MTLLGKVLVMVNLALSLLLAGWALGLYANRIDWSNNRGKDGAPDGELVARIARIKELHEALGPASNSWNANKLLLATLDGRRAEYKAWYDAQLAFNRSGATKSKPALVVKLVNGQPVATNPGVDERPVLEQGRDQFGQPLQSLVAYNQAEDALQQQIDMVSKNLTKLVEEDTTLTNQLVGDPGGSKGLQHRVLDERAKLAEANNEQAFVRPLLINAVVESDLVYRRERSLEARIQELEKIGVARESGNQRR